MTDNQLKHLNRLYQFIRKLLRIVPQESREQLEEEFDKIAEGNEDHIKVLREFYNEFEPKVKDAFSNMEKKPAEETGELCPNCNNPLVIKRSRYGEFTACSNYPECKYTKPLVDTSDEENAALIHNGIYIQQIMHQNHE